MTHPTPTTTPPNAPAHPGVGPSPWMVQARGFTARIERICASDPGARAALRSGVGKPLDEVRRMHPIVVPLLPPSARDDDTQRAFYTVASLIAAQKSDVLRARTTPPAGPVAGADEPGRSQKPQSTYGISLGETFAAAVAAADGLRENTAETRLNLLTRQSTAGLHRHLPSSVRQLCDKKRPPDWAQLLVHLRSWPNDRKTVGRRWLQDFYRALNQAALDDARRAADDTAPPDQI